MEYEYAIYCTCGAMRSGGGYSQPTNFSNADVLQKAVHNEGCPIVADPTQAKISSSTMSNVTIYNITT
jgi:hypothetical protein